MEHDAEHYQRTKDDESDWEPVEVAPEKGARRLSTMVSLRLRPTEAELLRGRAQAAGQTLSEYIRMVAFSASRSMHISQSTDGPSAAAQPAALYTHHTRPHPTLHGATVGSGETRDLTSTS